MEGITGIPSYSEDTLYAEKAEDKLGQKDFLKMFLAQLSNQDPLNPMEGSEFSAQLAQFSSLEQLFAVNQNLESMQSSQDQSAYLQALDLIGKEIVAAGDMLSLEQGKTSMGGFALDEAANCTAVITDPDGYPIRKISLGVLEAGQQAVEWDGRDEAGIMQEPGAYGFQITAVNMSDQILPVETRITGQVSRINLEGGSPVLYVGEIPLNLSQILDIRVPDASSTPTDQETTESQDMGTGP